MKKISPQWNVIYAKNGLPCPYCGKIDDPFLEQICDAQTDGIKKFKNHLEFQVVLEASPDVVGSVLNELGYMVQSGKRFKSGDLVDGILLDSPLRLLEMDSINGDRVLRVIAPDPNKKWPEDPDCKYPHNMQNFHMALLLNPNRHDCSDGEE